MIRRGFEYDRWASRRWLGSLGGFKQLDKAQAVLEHMLSAQQIWLNRCGFTIEHARENISLQDLFNDVTEAWHAVVDSADLDEEITHVTTKGEQFTNTIEQICFHVINHGTYHRGQLRGLAEADGYHNFPETDLILFLRESPS